MKLYALRCGDGSRWVTISPLKSRIKYHMLWDRREIWNVNNEPYGIDA